MSSQMIDRQYPIRAEQDDALQALAKRLDRKPAQLVREGIDLVLDQHGDEPNWLEETRKIRGLLADDPDIEERIAEARKSWDRVIEPPVE